VVTQSPRVRREEWGPLRSNLSIFGVGPDKYLRIPEECNVSSNQRKVKGGILAVAHGVHGVWSGFVAFIIGTSDYSITTVRFI
jgi:hypothetical protein